MSEESWLWFDVDDVLVDTSAELERSLRKLTGLHLPSHQWASHSFTDTYGLRPHQLEDMRAAWERDEVLERALPFDGAAEALRMAARKGYHVGLITARGWHPEGREITEAMARDLGMPVERVLLLKFEDSKRDLLLSTGTRVAGFLDDTARHVEGARSCGWDGRLVTRSWNVGFDLPRVGSTFEFVDSLPPAPSAARRPAPRAPKP